MHRRMNGKMAIIILVVSFICHVHTQTVTMTDMPQLRMAQTSIYDNRYIATSTNSPVDVTYITAFAAPLTGTPHKALVISGFQNYLDFQMIISLSILSVDQYMIKINIYVGANTFIKQMKVNYFVMDTAATNTLAPFIKVSIGDYRTIDLDDIDGPRKQTFINEASPFGTLAGLCSAIHGMQYFNTDGIINEVNVNTELVTAPNKIKHEVTIGEKGRLDYIRITTILIDAGWYSATNLYAKLAYAFQDTITDVDGFLVLQVMSDKGFFTATKSSFFFGIRGFNFTMEGTRLFLLDISTNPDFRANLNTNSFMKYTEISALVISVRACTTPTHFYHIQGFQCMAACTDLLEVTGKTICTNCDSVCVGCATDADKCKACKPGNNRVLAAATPAICKCDYDNGYVEVDGKDVCELCSTYLPGCKKCNSPLSCDDCGDDSLYEEYLYDGTNYKCHCLDNKYLVTGKCLSYPGCLEANQFITGEFCQKCDTANNFQKDLTNSSSCKCMLSYFEDPTNKSRCIDICGDKKTPESHPNAEENEIICDDGNKISGDGCSSSCRQQFGYKCTVQVPGQISICAQKQQIKIEYLYAQKNLIGNQATIVFSLQPPQNFLNADAFQNSIVTNISGHRKIIFDPKNSLIIITVDYSQTLQGKQYDFTFSFTGMKIYSSDIPIKTPLYGRNAKLEIGKAHQQVNIVFFVALAVSAFALLLALVAAFLGQKMMGIELILPVQAAFFALVTFPRSLLSPISTLWSLKFSTGYNILEKFDLTTNHMLDSRVTLLQYSGQYFLNYNVMFSLLGAVILMIGIIAIRLAWLQHQQRRLQQVLKKREDQQKDVDKKEKLIKKNKEKQSQNEQDEEKQTQQETKKEDQVSVESLEEALQDVRENIMNWKNFLYMILDRFFCILVVTAMMKVIFCFYIQLSNLTYTNEVYSNSLNAGFFFITYASIVTGLYAIMYDYKTDKFIVFTCNKGKYAMFYIGLFLAYIIVLGAVYETDFALYIVAVFSVIPFIFIPYQVPYGIRVLDFQTIIAIICQLPFITTIAISFLLNLQKDPLTQQHALTFSYVIIGTICLSIIATIARMIKMIDCKKISFIQFSDRKKDNNNDKNKKKNKIIVIDQLDLQKNNWDEFSQDSVRAVLHERKYEDQDDNFSIEKQNQQGYEAIAKKSDPKKSQKDNKDKDKKKDKQKNAQEEDDDEEIDQLQKIKMKLRKELKQKKIMGKVK